MNYTKNPKGEIKTTYTYNYVTGKQGKYIIKKGRFLLNINFSLILPFSLLPLIKVCSNRTGLVFHG